MEKSKAQKPSFLQVSSLQMPLFIQLHHMPSTWPVMLVATLHRSFWLKEIVRCGAANLPVVLVQSKLRGMNFLLKSWTKRIRRHRKILVLTFKVQARALPHCILIARFMHRNKWVTLILRTSIVWVKRHVSRDLSFESSLSWSAKIGGGLQEWTAHLDAQSLQAGLHYMLCVDLDGVPLVALDCLHCLTIFNTQYPPSPWNPTSSFRSLFDTLTCIFSKDNVTLPSGPTGFDVFASPVVASWQNISIRIWTSFKWQKPESLNMLNHLIFCQISQLTCFNLTETFHELRDTNIQPTMCSVLQRHSKLGQCTGIRTKRDENCCRLYQCENMCYDVLCSYPCN